jgi:hypothetical protein
MPRPRIPVTPKGILMHAIWRRRLASLIAAAALLVGVPAGLAAATAHSSGSLADCPAGTNWDNVTHSCV